MNELAVYWASELARATAALAVSALVVSGAMRLLRISSPRACRAAFCLVLVQGWLVVHPRIELPWGEPPAAESASVVAAREPQSPKHAETSARRLVTVAEPHEELPIGTSTEADAPVSPQTPAIAEVMSPRAARDPRGGGWLAAIATGLLLVWAGGIFAAAAALAVSYWRFLREIGVSRPLSPKWLDEWRQALAEQGGMQRTELLVTANVGPLVCWTPQGRRVLVPEELWRELNSVQRLAVLRHELAHCRRGDLWKSFAVRLLAAPHWFNPFAWRAVQRFDEAAEWACDALAQRTEEERLEYAKALLRLCQCRVSRRSLAAAAGGRRITARLERILSPQCKADSLINKAALAVCGAALLFAAWVRVELVVRAAEPTASAEVDDGASSASRPQQDAPADAKAEDPKADDAPPAERKAPTEIDASFLEMLARREAKFSTCRVEYVKWEDEGETPPAEEQRIEFARDGRGRWFRKEGRFAAGVRTYQYDSFAEQNGKRIISATQTNWNGLNPPQVQINQRPESWLDYDAMPLNGCFHSHKPLSSWLKDQEVRVEIVGGDAVLHWKRAFGQGTLHYEVQLSTEHDFTPVRFKHALEGGFYTEWRATQLKQADGVW